eukprot:s935_g24.t1
MEENRLYDKEADAVLQYTEDEKKAEEEKHAMGANDPLQDAGCQALLDDKRVDEAAADVSTSAPLQVEAQAASAPVSAMVDVDESDPGLAVPVTVNSSLSIVPELLLR